MRFPVFVGDHAVDRLVAFLKEKGFQKLALVDDSNTHAVLGAQVESTLRANGLDVNLICLPSAPGQRIKASDEMLIRVITRARRDEHIFISAGGGTLTDITRFSSFTRNTPFIAVPTAPSVDGYTSMGAPLIMAGLKQTVTCQAPLAVFADLPTLCAAPAEMIASGFGDMVCKLNASVDWQLGRLLIDEPFDAAICQRSYAAAQDCAEHASAIGTRDRQAIQGLMENLVESGFAMLDFGQSHPASGAEHHIGHFWEMKLLAEHRPTILHGAEVGMAAVLTSTIFQQLAQLSSADVQDRLAHAVQPTQQDELAAIRAAFGPMAEDVIAIQRPFLDMTPDAYAELKQRLIARWDEVRAILPLAPAPTAMQHLLREAGGVDTPTQLGLNADDISVALRSAHYLRNRLTALKLVHLFQLIDLNLVQVQDKPAKEVPM